jgi:hypothetical protein
MLLTLLVVLYGLTAYALGYKFGGMDKENYIRHIMTEEEQEKIFG